MSGWCRVVVVVVIEKSESSALTKPKRTRAAPATTPTAIPMITLRESIGDGLVTMSLPAVEFPVVLTPGGKIDISFSAGMGFAKAACVMVKLLRS